MLCMLTEINRFGWHPCTNQQRTLMDNIAECLPEGGMINYDGVPMATLYALLPTIRRTTHQSMYEMWLDSRIECEDKRQRIVGYVVTLICLLICIAAGVFF